MVKIKTTIGSHEIEVEVDDSQWEQGCCGCPTPEIDANLENCEVPDPELDRIVVPPPPPINPNPPDPPLEVPISVIASLLPCEEPGLGPCPEIVYHSPQEMEEIPEGLEPIVLDLSPFYVGELYLTVEIENHCCCDAEEDDDHKKRDRIHYRPKYKWRRHSCGKTPWQKFYGPFEVVKEPVNECTLKKTLVVHSKELRLNCGKWETRNPMMFPLMSVLEPQEGPENHEEVLYDIYIEQCKLWRQYATIYTMCGQIVSIEPQMPECLGPYIDETIEYVTNPRIVCQASNSPDTECACVATLTFTKKTLHIDGLCIVMLEDQFKNIQLPYIEQFEEPKVVNENGKYYLEFPRHVLDWCRYADYVVNADGEVVDKTGYCHCNLPPYKVELPVTSGTVYPPYDPTYPWPWQPTDTCGAGYNGSTYTVDDLFAVKKDNCICIRGTRTRLNFCNGRLMSTDVLGPTEIACFSADSCSGSVVPPIVDPPIVDPSSVDPYDLSSTSVINNEGQSGTYSSLTSN